MKSLIHNDMQRQLALELRATRGRSTWRAPKPRRSRRLLSLASLARA